MLKVRLKLRKVAVLIACLAVVTTVFAACEKPDEDNVQTGGEDVEFTIYVFGKESWTPFTGKTGVTFTNSDNEVLSIKDNGTTVEFTGKEIGNSTITATLGEQMLKALVRVRGMEGGKKYITYNKPVDAYYIEYSGGIIDANLPEKSTNCTGFAFTDAFAIAYENRKFSEVYTYGSGWGIRHIRTNGTSISSDYGSTSWYAGDAEIIDPSDPYAVEWREQPIDPQYPLDKFGAWVSKYKVNGQFMRYNGGEGGYGMAGNSRFPDKYELPNNTDVTELYIKNEKVMDIMCDVYKDTETIPSEGTRTWTFWVDPETGFTLKYEATDYDGTMMYRYEVSKLEIGKPDWDGLHLHPLSTDKVE